MDGCQYERLRDSELHGLFDRLFPHGFAGSDVLAEIATEGWEQSPLLACFHPSVERVFEERLQMHRNIESLGRAMSRRNSAAAPAPEPTIEDVRREYQAKPVKPEEELTELVGLCLWDVFSDNHDVITADGRIADIGSFRGAGAFLDEYLTRNRESWRDGDYLRFYLGTIWIARRADLTPVYAMIFRRLKALDADWVYHFPELRLIDLGPVRPDPEQPTSYSVSEAAASELKAQKHQAEVECFRADLADMNAQAREDAMDHPPPATVHAYRRVYGCDPRGWPPV